MDTVQATERQVMMLAPTERDAHVTCQILGSAGIAVSVCTDIADLCRQLHSGAGAVLLADESLVPDRALSVLSSALERQPKWSDVPVVLLASGGANSPIALQALEALPNVLVLDRPVHLPTLLSAMQTALRSRQRQFEIREHLSKLEQAEMALRESERRFREVLENSLDAAYRRRLQTDTYDYVSPVVKRVFDVEPAVLRAMSLDEFVDRIHPEDREGVRRAVEEGMVVGSARLEYRFRGDDGQYRWLADHFTVQKDQDGKPISLSGIVRDISDLRRAQDALKDDDRRKDEFLAMLGHELRNPLAAITAGLRLLPTSDSHEHAWVQESLERQTRHLVSLVDDLLDISRITQGKIQLKPQAVDLRTVVKRAAESTVDSMAERQHSFAITMPDERVCVLGDPVRLQQVVELHNGTVNVRSDGFGAGSEFTIQLPYVTSTAAVEETPDTSALREDGPLDILLVEDNRDAARTLTEVLKRQRHHVRHAADGAIAKRFQPDLVLCDLSLPGMSGYDVLRALQTETVLGSTLFVAVTGYSDEEDKQRTAEAGFHAHLVKPVSLESLQEIIGRLPKPAGVSP